MCVYMYMCVYVYVYVYICVCKLLTVSPSVLKGPPRPRQTLERLRHQIRAQPPLVVVGTTTQRFARWHAGGVVDTQLVVVVVMVVVTMLIMMMVMMMVMMVVS